jgi:protein TonB
MNKGFITHLSTMLVLHALLFIGSWKAVESQMNEKVAIPKLGNGMMKMKVASGLFMKSFTAPSVKKVVQNDVKKVVTSKPVPKAIEVPKNQQQESKAVSDSPSEGTSGRADGTGGTPDGYAFGNSQSGSGKISVMDLYKAELRATIDKNKYYPTLSKRLGQTGTVVVAFTLLENGNIIDVRIDKPSQYERLNVSALDAVKKVERFKPIPKEAGEEKMDIKVPIKFVTL